MVGVWLVVMFLINMLSPILKSSGFGTFISLCFISFGSLLATQRVIWSARRFKQGSVENKTDQVLSLLPWFGAFLSGVMAALIQKSDHLAMGALVGWAVLPAFASLAWVTKKGLKAHIDSFLYEQQQKKLNPATYGSLVKAKKAEGVWWLGWIGSGVVGGGSAWVGALVNQSLLFPENMLGVWLSAWPIAWVGSGAVFWSVRAWLQKKRIDEHVWDARLAAHVYFIKGWGVFAGLGLLVWCLGASVASWPIASALWAIQGGAFSIALLLGSRWLHPKRIAWEKNRLLAAESEIAAATQTPIAELVGRDPHPVTKPPTRILETKHPLPLEGLALVSRRTQPSQWLTGDTTFDAEVSVLINPKHTTEVVRRLVVILDQKVRDQIREGIQQGVVLQENGILARQYFTYEHGQVEAMGRAVQHMAMALHAACLVDNNWTGDAARERLLMHLLHDPCEDYQKKCAAALWRDHAMTDAALIATRKCLDADLPSILLHEAALRRDAEAVLLLLQDQSPGLEIEGVVWLWANCFMAQPEEVRARFFKKGQGRLMSPSGEAAEILLSEMVKYRPFGFEAWLCKQLEHENDDIQMKAIEAMQNVGGLESAKALKHWIDPHTMSQNKVREVTTFHVRYAAKQALKTIYERLGKNIGELALIEGGMEGALSEVEEDQKV